MVAENVESGIALSLEALSAVYITASYGGRDYSWEPYYGLYWIVDQRFQIDISGTYDTGAEDEDGNPIMAPYVIPVKIAGE